MRGGQWRSRGEEDATIASHLEGQAFIADGVAAVFLGSQKGLDAGPLNAGLCDDPCAPRMAPLIARGEPDRVSQIKSDPEDGQFRSSAETATALRSKGLSHGR